MIQRYSILLPWLLAAITDVSRWQVDDFISRRVVGCLLFALVAGFFSNLPSNILLRRFIEKRNSLSSCYDDGKSMIWRRFGSHLPAFVVVKATVRSHSGGEIRHMHARTRTRTRTRTYTRKRTNAKMSTAFAALKNTGKLKDFLVIFFKGLLFLYAVILYCEVWSRDC